MVKNGALVKHNCGHYFQQIPIDKVTGFAAIPYEEAEALGYFKIDFLHLSVLDSFDSKAEMREMLQREPDWSILLDESQVPKLFHVGKYADLLTRIKPNSVQQLADCLALIRPAKRYLLSKYMKDKDSLATRRELYQKVEGAYYFKKSHAISYALTITLQLHLISQGRL
jgi:DNA polymerase III alpha subunit